MNQQQLKNTTVLNSRFVYGEEQGSIYVKREIDDANCVKSKSSNHEDGRKFTQPQASDQVDLREIASRLNQINDDNDTSRSQIDVEPYDSYSNHKSRIERIRAFKVGSRVTVKGRSRHIGDAQIVRLNTGNSNDHVMIEFDDKSISIETDPLLLELYEETPHTHYVQEQLKLTSTKISKLQERERQQFIELQASQQGLFLWRGLRYGESGYGGLHAKDPRSNLDAESSVLNSLATRYIHCSKSPMIAIYYAAAFNPFVSDGHDCCRLAQIDASKLHPDSSLDISDGASLRSPQAKILASTHQIVLIREHIPACAVTYHNLHDLRVPRGVRGSANEYVDRLLQLPRVLNTVNTWKLEMLQNMLVAEINEKYSSIGDDERYPMHLVAIARYISKLQQGHTHPSDKMPLWKKVLLQGKPIEY